MIEKFISANSNYPYIESEEPAGLRKKVYCKLSLHVLSCLHSIYFLSFLAKQFTFQDIRKSMLKFKTKTIEEKQGIFEAEY